MTVRSISRTQVKWWFRVGVCCCFRRVRRKLRYSTARRPTLAIIIMSTICIIDINRQTDGRMEDAQYCYMLRWVIKVRHTCNRRTMEGKPERGRRTSLYIPCTTSYSTYRLGTGTLMAEYAVTNVTQLGGLRTSERQKPESPSPWSRGVPTAAVLSTG